MFAMEEFIWCALFFIHKRILKTVKSYIIRKKKFGKNFFSENSLKRKTSHITELLKKDGESKFLFIFRWKY